jgi:hypothetical protein
MSQVMIAFSVGLIVGTIFGVFVICFLQMAKEGGRSLE